jgi:hypothetical protein
MPGGFTVVVNGGVIPKFNPCEMDGMQIEAEYNPDEGKTDSGVIRVLQVSVRENRTPLPTGTAIATGKVTGVTCHANEMTLTLILRSGKSAVLHSADYTKITYLAGANSSLGDMDPCSQLKGRAVEITYSVAAGKRYSGEVQKMIVGK